MFDWDHLLVGIIQLLSKKKLRVIVNFDNEFASSDETLVWWSSFLVSINVILLTFHSLHRYYYVTMSVGEPPKPYFLDIDTGSDLTWLQCDAPCTKCTPVTFLLDVFNSLVVLRIVLILCWTSLRLLTVFTNPKRTSSHAWILYVPLFMAPRTVTVKQRSNVITRLIMLTTVHLWVCWLRTHFLLDLPMVAR